MNNSTPTQTQAAPLQENIPADALWTKMLEARDQLVVTDPEAVVHRDSLAFLQGF
jgi:hypothetical protein